MPSDLIAAVRAVLRGRALVAAAVVTFALGVGLNVMVLGLVDRLMFRPLPFADPDRLVHIHLLARSDPGLAQSFMPYAMTRVLAERDDLFEGIAWADGAVEETAAIAGQNPLRLTPVTVNTLDLLGVTPILGHGFSSADDDDERERVVLLTAEAWQRDFAGAESVLDLRWHTEYFTYRVIGVLPPGFLLPSSRLLGRFDGLFAYRNPMLEKFPRGPMTVGTFARLQPGVPLAAAQVAGDQVSDIPWEAGVEPTGPPAHRVTVQPLQAGFTILVRPYLWLVTASVWIVFAVAVVNLAALLLTWGRWRADDAAIRLALGASPSRLFRIALLEAAVICVLGAAAGWTVYLATHALVLRVVPGVVRDFAVDGWDGRLLAATIGFAVCGAAAAGVFPALASRRTSLTQAMSARSTRSGRSSRGLTPIVLGAEAALGVVVLTGAALTVPPFVSLLTRSPGFDPDGLYALRVGHGVPPGPDAMLDGAPARQRAEAVLEVLRAAPGVARASAVIADPFAARFDPDGFWRNRGVEGVVLPIGPGYRATLGVSLMSGRDFTGDEHDDAGGVAVLNEAAVRVLWPGDAPSAVLGRTVDAGRGGRVVVGVYGNVRSEPGAPVLPTMLVPLGAAGFRAPQSSLPVFLRMEPGRTPDPVHLRALLDDRFGRGGLQVESVAARIEPMLEQPRFLAVLFGVLGGVTLFLIIVALHAVTTFEVVQRRRETGIRLALGSTTAAVRRRVLAVTLWPMSVGVVAGGVLALWAVRRFPDVMPAGATARAELVVAAIVVLTVGAIAAWVPTRVMARTDPAVTLRAD